MPINAANLGRKDKTISFQMEYDQSKQKKTRTISGHPSGTTGYFVLNYRTPQIAKPTYYAKFSSKTNHRV